MSGLVINPYLVVPGTPLFCDAADFDGTNDYMTTGAGLTGAADGKQVLLSYWVRADSLAATGKIIGATTTVGGATLRFSSQLASNGRVNIVGTNAAGGSVLSGSQSAGGITVDGLWHHVIMSVDMTDTAKRFIYVDGAAVTVSWVAYNNDNIDYTVADWSIGAIPDGTSKMNACLAEVFFHTSYLDISVQSNREKFRTSAGKPENLGADGSTPLGVQPLVYQHIAGGAAVTTFANNLGSGGNFAITGALDLCSSSPSA